MQARPDSWYAEISDLTYHHPAFNRQIAKLSTLAKLTQARYGTIIPPATFDLCKNATVVATIANLKNHDLRERPAKLVHPEKDPRPADVQAELND